MHIYAGPTISDSEIRSSAPDARLPGPIRHGDLFDSEIRCGDTVLIIDGVYHHATAIRHKEILHALTRGIRVVGGASIGASRAADLASLGMVGVGEIFEWYRDGIIDDDAEVAVAHAPTGDRRGHTVALVNVRHMLRLASAAGCCSDDVGFDALRRIRDIYYAERTFQRIRSVLRDGGHIPLADWLFEQARRDRNFGDLKRSDARRAVAACAALAPLTSTVPAGWVTGYVRDWRNRFTVERAEPARPLERVRYQQLFAPNFPDVWREFLSETSLAPVDGSAAMSIEQRLRRLLPTRADPVDSPTARLFRPMFDVDDPRHIRLLLGAETAADVDVVTRYRRADRDFTVTQVGVHTGLLSPTAATTLLRELWRCPADALDDNAIERGFRSGRGAIAALAPFAVGYLRDIAGSRDHEEATA
ncbi:TfuA-like protein [Nocardia arthritidis]|uniref:TfuA-like protein n=1 Tax=Nocardia arthritidis TaxID=228602 RepID=UPI00142E581F|nr:TfuA-like protein [Nocardia arthritidis]